MVASPRHLLVPVQFAAELVALGHQPLYPLAPAPAPASRRHQLRRTAGRAGDSEFSYSCFCSSRQQHRG
ncbi:hypothetical protein DAI22_09g154050 [Oryza sativa Japonica Group]|nr:hypothetical protein DAI22_09g154050 [Oryza sativa Japonica Group]